MRFLWGKDSDFYRKSKRPDNVCEIFRNFESSLKSAAGRRICPHGRRSLLRRIDSERL